MTYGFGRAGEIEALERNAWSMFAELGRGPGGSVMDTPTRLVVTTPIPQPPYNAVWRFYSEPDRPLTDQVGELLTEFDARSVTMMWLVHPTSEPRLTDVLAEHGLVCAEEVFGMITDLTQLADVPDPSDGVTVGEARAADPHDWVHLVSWRYGLATDASEYIGQMFRNALDRTTRIWIARVNGEPVSKVGLHVDPDGVAGVYGVATTEAGRNRGLASLLTLTALHAARDEGASMAVLHSTPMAHGLYARLGFRDVAPFTVWARPDTVHL